MVGELSFHAARGTAGWCPKSAPGVCRSHVGRHVPVGAGASGPLTTGACANGARQWYIDPKSSVLDAPWRMVAWIPAAIDRRIDEPSAVAKVLGNLSVPAGYGS